jgi:aminopeptidase N
MLRHRLALIALALISLAANEATPPPPKLRLPAGVRPTRYTLDLRVVPAEPKFSGTITIDLDVTTPTPLVWLNATDLDIDGAELHQSGAVQPLRVVPGDSDFVGFAAPRPLAKGAAQLIVRWRGTLDSERSRGLYRVAEGKGADDWYAYTFFESIDARRAFPSFDEPAFKVPWKLTLHVKKGHVALANSPVESERDEPDGMKAVTMVESKPLPSYLVAFVVGPFELVDGGKAGRANTPIRFIVPRGRAAETRYARAVTPRIVDELEKFFAMPYPYGKLDVAVVPRFWGTMEHPGIVALGQPLTLIKPDQEGLFRHQGYANIAIHELAHYWFGDYVTCRWWNDVWLNESLAEWADGKITDALEPSWKISLSRDNAAHAMRADGQPTVQAVRLAVESKDGIANAFDNNITYDKGEALLHMLEHWVGEARFLDALHGYLAAHAWGNADADDFMAALQKSLGPAPAEVMRSFIEQPGLPIVTAKLHCDGGAGKVTLSQQRFFNAGPRSSPAVWKVPVCLRWQDGGTCELLDKREKEVALPVCPAWLATNADGAGYYRVRYDAASLASLRGPFTTALTVKERMGLAADVAAEVQEGALPIGDALALLPAFLADSDVRVFDHGLDLMYLVKPRELDDNELAAFGRAVTKLLGARAKTIGWAPVAGEDPETATARDRLLSMMAWEARDRAVIAKGHELTLRWLHDRRAIAPDLQWVVLSIGAASDDPKLFDAMLAEARRVSDRRERGLLLGTLGQFRAPELRQRALALFDDKQLDQRELRGLVARMIYDRVSREPAWQWLQQHFDAIIGKMREDEAMWLFKSVPQAFCDEKHRAEAEAFLGARAQAHPGAAHTLAEALEEVKACTATRERDRAAVSAFLAQYGSR